MLKEKKAVIMKNMIIFMALGVIGGIFLLRTLDGNIISASNKFRYGTGVFLAVVVVYIVLRKVEWLLKKIPDWCVYLWTLLFFVALTYVSIRVRNVPTADYEVVYDAVLAYLNGQTVGWEYFSRWTNNYFLFWLLVCGGKLSLLLGIQDIFYVLVTFNALATSVAALCVYKIIAHYEPDKKYLQYFGAAMMIAFIPLWAGTQYMYSDSTSLLFGVATVLCCLKGKEKNPIFFLLGGVTATIGLLIKPTVCICVISYLIIEFLFCYQKGEWKKYLIFFATAALLLGGFSVVKQRAPYHQYDAEYKVPFQFWFALGLLKDGSFSENLDFAEASVAAPTYQEREKAANDVIKEEIGQLVTWDHIRDKALCNFGNGTFGCYLFQYHGGLGYVLFNPFGQYGDISANISTVYFGIILLCSGIAAVLMLVSGKNNSALMMSLFAFFGLVVFLMLWEANNRQLYNQIPLLALMGSLSIDYVAEAITLFWKKRKGHLNKKVVSERG